MDFLVWILAGGGCAVSALSVAAALGAWTYARMDHQRVRESVATLSRVKERLREYAKANRGYEETTTTLEARLEQVTALLLAEREQRSVLAGQKVREVQHLVFLDGMPASGKSTIAECLLRPWRTRDELSAIASTEQAYETARIVVAREFDQGPVVHTVGFVDVPGEAPEQVIDFLQRYLTRAPEPEVPGATAERGMALMLVVWDLSKGIDENLRWMNAARVRSLYNNQRARETFRRILFFLNKTDTVATDLDATLRSAAVDAVVADHWRHIEGKAFDEVRMRYPALEHQAGSALTGEGLRLLNGAILRALELDRLVEGTRPATTRDRRLVRPPRA